jgi:hypothetical protein
LDGLVRFLASSQKSAQWLRKYYAFHIFPMVDVDGVVNGYYGKDRAPTDFNRAWLVDSPRTEIRQLLKYIFSEKHNSAFVCDFHSPCAGDPNFYFMPPENASLPHVWQINRFFADTLAHISPPKAILAAKDVLYPTYSGDAVETQSVRSLSWAKDIPGGTFELSYNADRQGHVITRKSYQSFGAAVGKALYKTFSKYGLVSDAGQADDVSFHKNYLLWQPLKHVTERTIPYQSTRALRLACKRKNSYVYLASPRQPLPESNSIRIHLRIKTRTPKTKLETFLRVFYYDKRGLRFQKQEIFRIPASGTWKTRSFELSPPKTAQNMRICFKITGGPATVTISDPPAFIR